MPVCLCENRRFSRVFTRLTSLLVACLLASWLLVACVGCREDASIRKYRVAKSETRRSAPTVRQDSQLSEQEMLGAIVPHEDTVWFFKATGEPSTVDKYRAEIKQIVSSVRFADSGDPSWQLSEGWTEVGPRDQGITYAKLRNKEDLTVTVTRLFFDESSGAQQWQDYVVTNVNRWRGQLSLASQQWQEMVDELEEVPELSQGAAKAYFVSLLGRGSGAMSSAPFANAPFAGGPQSGGPQSGGPQSGGPQSGGSPEPSETSRTGTPSPAPDGAGGSPQANQLSYTVPANWTEIDATGMRRAAFTIQEGESSAEVTVIAAGGSIEANIGIWMGQVGIESSEASKQAIIEGAIDIEVNGVSSRVFTLDEKAAAASADAAAELTSAILVADVPWRAGESLFVKLKGPPSLVEAQREPFVEFLKSMKW